MNYSINNTMSISSDPSYNGGATWDETQWEFDPASGVNTAKQYADGSRIAYDYTDNGKKTRTTWARGAWKQNAYNERNLVSGTTYSGTVTPSVSCTYADSGKTASATLSDGKPDDCSDNLADLTADVMGVDIKNAKGGCECACKRYYMP